MKIVSQREKIFKDIKRITRPSELQEYLRENVPFEDLTDVDFVAELRKANPAVKSVLDMVLLDKEADEADEIEEEVDLDTMEGIEEYVNRAEINVALAKHRDKVLLLARFYEEQGDYSKAQKYYEVIVENGKSKKEKFMQKLGRDDKDTIYYKARIGTLSCKSNMGQDLTDEEKDELAVTLETVSSTEKPIDAFLTYFSPISTELLLNGDFDAIMKKGGTRRPGPRPKPSHENEREYIAELSPDKRLKYLVENYEISRAYTGMGVFEGSVVLDIPDKNILIVEKFFEPRYEGETEPRPAYGSSTIIVNKNIELNLEEMTRGQLVEMGQTGNKRIGRVYHRGASYYDRVSSTINRVSRAVQEKKHADQETVVPEEITASVEPMKTMDTEETVFSEETVEENGRTMDEVLKEMESLDTAYESMQAALTKAREEQQRIASLNEQVEQVRSKVNDAISGKMTSEVSAIVLEQSKLLKELKNELSELERTTQALDVQECELEIAKNREKRERLNEEIRNMLGE